MTVKRIPKVPINKVEQETSIVIDPLTKKASQYTCIPTMVKKAYEMAEDEDVRIILDNKYGIEIEIPSNWIKVSKPRKMEYTEAQKEAMRNRLAKARQRQKEKKTDAIIS